MIGYINIDIESINYAPMNRCGTSVGSRGLHPPPVLSFITLITYLLSLVDKSTPVKGKVQTMVS